MLTVRGLLPSDKKGPIGHLPIPEEVRPGCCQTAYRTDSTQEPIRLVSQVTNSESGSARLARDKYVIPGTEHSEKIIKG